VDGQLGSKSGVKKKQTGVPSRLQSALGIGGAPHNTPQHQGTKGMRSASASLPPASSQ
jgi:hypothetical protein